MKSMKLDVKSLVGVAVSVAVLYVTVYYGGQAWKRSQDGEKLL
jgi:hypothetical protein